MEYIKVGNYIGREERNDKKVHFHEHGVIFEVESKENTDFPGWYYKAGINTEGTHTEWEDELGEIAPQGYSVNKNIYREIKKRDRYTISDLIIHDKTAKMFMAMKDPELAEKTKDTRPGHDKKAEGAVDFWVFPVYAFEPVMVRDTQNLEVEFKEEAKQQVITDSGSQVHHKSEYETLKCPQCKNTYSTPEDFREHLKDHATQEYGEWRYKRNI